MFSKNDEIADGVRFMSKKINRVPVYLDSGTVQNIPYDEVKAILRAADELIGKGGRNLLVKILKGSKDKKVLELGLDHCPAYGYYHGLAMSEIGNRVDWMIEQDYIHIEYDYRLPVLVFSPRGWEIEKRSYSEEVYNDFCKAVIEQDESIIKRLREQTNRQVVLIVLELLKQRGEIHQIPMLEKWQSSEVKKIRAEIGRVVSAIRENPGHE